MSKWLALTIVLSGCNNSSFGHGHMHWDMANQQELICDATQEVVSGVHTRDGGQNWIVDENLSQRMYVNKAVAMHHAEEIGAHDCPSN